MGGTLLDNHLTNLIEEEVVNVVGEESSELTLLGLTRPHVLLNLLNKSVEKKVPTNKHKDESVWLINMGEVIMGRIKQGG